MSALGTVENKYPGKELPVQSILQQNSLITFTKKVKYLYNAFQATGMMQQKSQSKHFEKLSPMENDIIAVLWQGRRMYVRDIYNCLKTRRKVALTSIAVNLDRLHKKGVVDRQAETGKGGFRYLYSPAKGKREYEKAVIDNAVNKLIERFGRTAVSYFNERFSR